MRLNYLPFSELWYSSCLYLYKVTNINHFSPFTYVYITFYWYFLFSFKHAGYLGKKSSQYRLKTALTTDERVRLTNEIITGIQAIKMYTWEKPFSQLIERARRYVSLFQQEFSPLCNVVLYRRYCCRKEISVIRAMSLIRGVTMSFILFTTRMSLFATIVAYIMLGNKITAEKVFMLQAFYNILRLNMTVFFPQGKYDWTDNYLTTIN